MLLLVDIRMEGVGVNVLPRNKKLSGFSLVISLVAQA